jgi:UDP-2,3-diacylglucosamine hydrolase
MIKLEHNAIFIADSHYNNNRIELIQLLEDIKQDKIKTNQIFLMGDIFDFLSSQIEYFCKINKLAIDILNDLAKQKDIIYLEGNHDFNLKPLFPNIYIVPRDLQPIFVQSYTKTIAISHGDIYTPFVYNIYSYIFRSHTFQKILNFIDINNIISKYFTKKLANKSICKTQDNFVDFINMRKILYNTELVIEGHYHQGYIDNEYINIPSFYCDKAYLVYNLKDDIFSLDS